MPNRVAIMQPYVFPYVGYMNLVQASDKFVFYDDVHFIKKGWINRNRIMLMGEPYRFSIPLKQQSQNSLIKDSEVSDLPLFAEKFLKQLNSSYKNSPYKDSVLDYVREVLMGNQKNISEIAIASIEHFFRYIGVKKEFHYSSKQFSSTRGLAKAERLIKITQLLNSSEYINAINGTSLYTKTFFASQGIVLNFIKPSLMPYQQFNRGKKLFQEGLSIIDLMMNLSERELCNQLNDYTIV